MAAVSEELQQIYMVYLNRPADPAGLAYWEKAVANGATLESIAANFAASSEFQTAHQGQTSQQQVESFYKNLFGRAGDADGVAFWVKALGNGATLADIGTTILHAAQNTDAATIHAKTTAAGDFTAMLAKQDVAAANALLAKAAVWLSAITDAASQAKASAGLDDFAATALQPTVLDVTSPLNFTKSRGPVDITVTFSSIVNVDTSKGTPTLTLETGKQDTIATYTGGSGTNKLTFSFSLKGGETTSDLDYVSSTALALNGATIKDAGLYDALLALPAPGAAHSLSANQSIVLDTTAPLLLGTTPGANLADVSPGANIELHFNEALESRFFNLRFTIKDASGSQVIEIGADNFYLKDFTVSEDRKTIILNPQVGLLPNTSYSVVLHGSVSDSAGNGWGDPYDANPYGSKPYHNDTVLRFTTGDAAVPTLTAGSGANAGTLFVSGDSSGNTLVIDLNKHTISEGSLPAGTFTNVDTSKFDTAIKLQGLDGAHNTLTGTLYVDTLSGGNAVNGVAALNEFHGDGGSDTLVAGSGSDNVFHYALSDYYGNSATDTTHGMETLNNWGAARSNTISFDGLHLVAGSGDGKGVVNGNFITSMHIQANGLAVFDSIPEQYDRFVTNSDIWYQSWYVAEAMGKVPVGTTAVFNYKNDAYLVVREADPLYGHEWAMIKVTGVHSDGLVFDANGNLTTGTFIANS